jgi:hypothetical protein
VIGPGRRRHHEPEVGSAAASRARASPS